MFESCVAKQSSIKSIFEKIPSPEGRYEKIIEFGKNLPKLNNEFKTPKHLVSGCQSQTYLIAYSENGLIYFEVGSDALISAGLAALLLNVYNGETAETILKCPPQFIDDIGISASLTPSRANGLYSIHLRMKQEALRLLITPN